MKICPTNKDGVLFKKKPQNSKKQQNRNFTFSGSGKARTTQNFTLIPYLMSIGQFK
jgi:hypothetical protein